MNYKFIIGCICLVISLSSCHVTQRTTTIYPLINDTVTNGYLYTNLDIGKRVEGKFSGIILPFSGNLLGRQYNYLLAQNEAANLTRRALRRARRLDPYHKAKQVALYEAIKNTKYDIVLNPIYIVRKDGLRITITVHGFGATIKSIQQDEYLRTPMEHTINLIISDSATYSNISHSDNALESVVEYVSEQTNTTELTISKQDTTEPTPHNKTKEQITKEKIPSVVIDVQNYSPIKTHEIIVRTYKENKKTGNIVYKSYTIVYNNLSPKSRKKDIENLLKVQTIVIDYLENPTQYRTLISELKQATSDSKKLKAFLKTR